jgi:hypothetical protein
LSKKLGFSDAWIREALEPQNGSASVFKPDEKAVQAFAIAAGMKIGRDCEAEFKALVEAIGSEKAVAVLWLVTRTVSHALISNTLKLASPVKSIFAS